MFNLKIQGMKRFSIWGVLFVMLVVASCSKEQTQEVAVLAEEPGIVQSEQGNRIFNATQELRELQAGVSANRELMLAIRPSVKTRSEAGRGLAVDTAAVVALADSLYESSYALLQKLELSKEDIQLVYGKDLEINELSRVEVVGLALFLDMSFRTTTGMRTRSVSHDDIVHCALDASGIVAVGYLVDQLAGKAISRAAIKAVLKAGLKAGGRVLGGIGLAIMVAEFSYCLYEAGQVE